ncbi:MAG: alpha-galactosidase [Lentisphaeria bacterium]|jgi:alpha-galactosidase|nr:alpha-galactosidase [Lentisphaeria bacterium]
MPKIALIGAGSIVFAKTLVHDILATPALAGSEIRLMSRTWPKLERMRSFVERMIAENGVDATVWATLDRREALRGADFVIVMIQVGGTEAFRHDIELPLKYGIDQCIGDSLGPGGVFRGLRTIPILADIARDMAELCPRAILLNYTNPMGACCHALGQVADIPFVGLCHGVQTTLDLISRYVDVPKEDIEFQAAGINHMAWFLQLRDRRDGRDLNPILRERIERPEYYVNDKVRCEVMRHFGYFMTESTGHLSEYLPWFRSSRRALDTYCDMPAFGGETGAALAYGLDLKDKFRDVDYLQFESPKIGARSVEYCSYILEAVVTGHPFRLNGNVRNDGYIANLPQGCCVEVPILVDQDGLHPVPVGALPSPLAAMNQSNISVQTLAVEAALSGDPETVVAAVALDPLASACCTLAEIRALVAELLEAERQWLPQFGGHLPRPTPAISIPADVRPVDVPLDPALAIAHRFGELARRATK